MKNLLETRVHITEGGSTIRKEGLAGITTFIANSYIVAVNGTILSMTGMSYGGITISTGLTAFVGCMLIANAPLVLVPGMGDNVFFVFVLVASFGLTWQQSLTATLMANPTVFTEELILDA
ncbi:hypothetical protein ACWOFR_04660 [Carnobacterium gallinarum]|uniref:hypothetical protein n=1 Tax=Carnobacterium gallinarum TaxID=2749 RepID=UPI00054F1E75|nr:hypothetical protein [Carnobacterium gallinarum]